MENKYIVGWSISPRPPLFYPTGVNINLSGGGMSFTRKVLSLPGAISPRPNHNFCAFFSGLKYKPVRWWNVFYQKGFISSGEFVKIPLYMPLCKGGGETFITPAVEVSSVYVDNGA